MHKNNADIRQALQKANVKQWQLAERLGVSENTLIRKLRHELPAAEKAELKRIIAQ